MRSRFYAILRPRLCIIHYYGVVPDDFEIPIQKPGMPEAAAVNNYHVWNNTTHFVPQGCRTPGPTIKWPVRGWSICDRWYPLDKETIFRIRKKPAKCWSYTKIKSSSVLEPGWLLPSGRNYSTPGCPDSTRWIHVCFTPVGFHPVLERQFCQMLTVYLRLPAIYGLLNIEYVLFNK